MPYQRKTQDAYAIEQWAGEGWEEVCEEASRKDAKAQAACYRENQPQYPIRIRKHRVPITQQERIPHATPLL